MLPVAGLILLAYLLGSIPTAVLYGRFFHKVDVREFGSGNAGATNSLRVLGKKAGLAVLIIDMLKGFLAIFIAKKILGSDESTLIIVGFAAVIGHLLPIFAGFKGGKGIATSFGVILALNPYGALVCLVVFAIVLTFSKYVSLASLMGSFSFIPFNFFRRPDEHFFHAMALALFLLLLFTHRENVKRLLAGNENKYPPK
ncbi:glycerol-3-phosphate 1-O-acyltransferase PlsY [uncultured Arcticibacterium sp.]|uniref:glycerol-3-phosphate 1-O-acyltransferase PlsY n=1 Tax=uncultured Arcticibacterium sp. TaxID=2173042 RepID=UPI0030FC36BE